jgi:Ca2+-binding RTX toxin-like protein
MTYEQDSKADIDDRSDHQTDDTAFNGGRYANRDDDVLYNFATAFQSQENLNHLVVEVHGKLIHEPLLENVDTYKSKLFYRGDLNATLHGSDGDDYLDAGNSDDELHGEDGDDRLVGGEGDDDYYGGDGNDEFYVDKWGGHDVVHDYATGDKILVPADVWVHVNERDGYVEIAYGHDDYYDKMDVRGDGVDSDSLDWDHLA